MKSQDMIHDSLNPLLPAFLVGGEPAIMDNRAETRRRQSGTRDVPVNNKL
jgi:hypothetical protein